MLVFPKRHWFSMDDTFGVHQSTVSKMVIEVCAAITENLSSDYIKLPTTEDEMRKKVAEFDLR